MISSTASQLPILGKGAVESALKQRRHKPIFMVDIAVPRDIETEVGELDDVYLYTVDDLHDVVAENLKSRQGAAQAAEELVSVGAEDFMLRLRELAAVDVLRAYRQQSERLRDEELQKALRLLANGGNPEDVLAQLARGLTNKLLHAPSVRLKNSRPRAASMRWPWPRNSLPSMRAPRTNPRNESVAAEQTGNPPGPFRRTHRPAR